MAVERELRRIGFMSRFKACTNSTTRDKTCFLYTSPYGSNSSVNLLNLWPRSTISRSESSSYKQRRRITPRQLTTEGIQLCNCFENRCNKNDTTTMQESKMVLLTVAASSSLGSCRAPTVCERIRQSSRSRMDMIVRLPAMT